MSKIDMKKAGGYYLFGNLFNKGFAFITVPIFSRILSTSDYGIVTTYNSWISILSMIMGFAIYMGIRAAFVDYRDRINDFLSVSTTFTISMGLIVSLFVIGGLKLVKIDVSITLVYLCLLQGIAAAIIQNYSMYLMMQYRYKFRTALMVLPNLISVMVSIVAVLFITKQKPYMGRIVPTSLIYVVFGFIIVCLIYKKSKVLINTEYLKYGLSISAPLVLHGIALNILSQSDRTMITVLADASQTGIYSLIYNFSMIATVITTSLDGIWIPWFTEKLKNNQVSEINTKVKDYIMIMTYAMIGVILVGPEVVKLLASQKYWEGIRIIPPIVLANYVIFAYTLYVNIEHFYKKTLYITINTVIAAGINIVLNLILIPKYGCVAAAYTTLISYIISFILHANYAKKLVRDLYPFTYFIGSSIIIIVSVVVFYLFMNTVLIRWGLLLLMLLTIGIKERRKIKELLLKID